MRGWRLPALVTIVVLLGGLGWLLWQNRPIPVDVVAARTGQAVEMVYATGYVEPVHPAELASRVTAPVRDVLVREGDRVRRGQLLIRLAEDEQRFEISRLRAERERTALEERRIVALARQGWVTRSARDQAVAAARAARAAESAATARLDHYAIRSAMDGIVLTRDVEPGDLATPTSRLMTLGNPADLWITATVDERDVPRIRAGQRALMSTDAFRGRQFGATVRAITPGGDPQQRAFRARLAPDEPGQLPIGLTLEVNIVTRREDRALLVPTAALDGARLWMIENDRARSRPVGTGIRGARMTQIVSGLAAGTLVIVNPPDGLEEGSRVKPRKAP